MSSKSLAINVHTQANSNGIALQRLIHRLWVLTNDGRKTATKPSNEVPSRVSRNMARSISTTIQDFKLTVSPKTRTTRVEKSACLQHALARCRTVVNFCGGT